MFDEPIEDPDWVPVRFYDPNDFEYRQDVFPDPEGFYFPEEDD